MDVVPAGQLDPTAFADALAVWQRGDLALDPDIEPTTEAELRAHVDDDRTDGNRHLRWAVIDGDTVAAFAHLELEDDDNNRHFASAELRGATHSPAAGRAALATMVDVAEHDGRTVLMGWAPDTAEDDAFWTGVGAVRGYTEQMSDLDLAAVDPALMRAWIDARLERAAELELVAWTDRCPDAHLDAYAVSMAAMSDAPNEDLSVNDWEVTPDDVREDEDARAAIGSRIRVIMGLTPDGEPVGHTSVHENLHRSAASWQWDTVVLDAHRRRGIARWLKAEMWRRLRDEAPHLTRLRTGNAASNDPMLAINVAMGYRPVHRFGGWEAPLADYRAALGG